MDRGFEQLILLAIVLLAAVIDLFVRSIKRKARRAELPQAEDEPVLQAEDEPVFIEEDDVELLEPVRAEHDVIPTPPLVQRTTASFKPQAPPSRPAQPALSRRLRRQSSLRWLRRRGEA
ncbi:MAG: hypothetical protein ACREOG_05870, partial [Gemmatimonadaceae bacterium]